MKINPLIFREYDIRGIVDKDLSVEFAYLLGRAFAQFMRDSKAEMSVAVGHDCRHSSRGYAESLMRGLTDEGANCFFTGMGPTPQLYYAIFAKGYGGGIQVTGSHNPPDMNGFKLCLGKHTLSGSEIQDLKGRVEKLIADNPPPSGKGEIQQAPIMEEYIRNLSDNVKPYMGERKIKVVVDAGNGVAGMTGPEILKNIGAEVHTLYCEPDGSFPNHHPDPTVLSNLKDLIAKVKEVGADLGIGWDGDGDRIGAVDENGDVIYGDMLLLIFGRDILRTAPGATIIGDVKCSEYLFTDLRDKGANAIMYKTGHSLIKNKLFEVDGKLGGEMSGHIFFKDRFFGFDDAVYASARLIEILSRTDMPASKLVADLPARVSTPEIRVECPDEIKFEVVKRAKDAFAEYKVNTTDGVRITFENGWGLIRASNTQPVLVMRFEASDESHLAQYQETVTEAIDKIRASIGR